MKRKIKKLTAILSVFCFSVLALTALASQSIPGRFSVSSSGEVALPTQLPMVLKTAAGSDRGTVRLFGVFPVANPAVERQNEIYVVPGGTPFGIKIFAAGVMVIEAQKVVTEKGSVCPAKLADIREGDLILTVNGSRINTNQALQEMVAKSKGKPLSVTLKRQEKGITTTITPVKDVEGHLRLGLWVRDSTAGLGTLTFYDPATGVYGGLGHGVCDPDTGERISVRSGEIVSASVVSIKKATAGAPGELRGVLDDSKKLGTLAVNTAAGVYGRLYAPLQGQTVRVAKKQEVKTGKAMLYCSVNGRVDGYTCRIVKVDMDSADHRDMILRVTDPRLITRTGGIVQGVSGSPILQNGALIGAVTHVFVNTPQKGCAIFAETMVKIGREAVKEKPAA